MSNIVGNIFFSGSSFGGEKTVDVLTKAVYKAWFQYGAVILRFTANSRI